MGGLVELLRKNSPDMPAIEAHLDALDATERLGEIRSLGREQQARLFESAAGHRALALEHLVPVERGVMQEVIHEGKNSLPVFNHFAKAFVLPEPGASEVWGYNRAGGFIETVVGPGYFVAYPHEVDGELLVDYLRVPPRRPDHWPEIVSNSARLSLLVYNGTQDVLRGVSSHVTIGRATKGGKAMSAWFVLCRSDES